MNGANSGSGVFENLEIQSGTKDNTYKKYLKTDASLNLVLTLFCALLALIVIITITAFIYIRRKFTKTAIF